MDLRPDRVPMNRHSSCSIGAVTVEWLSLQDAKGPELALGVDDLDDGFGPRARISSSSRSAIRRRGDGSTALRLSGIRRHGGSPSEEGLLRTRRDGSDCFPHRPAGGVRGVSG